MNPPPLEHIIEACKRAISEHDFDTLTDYYADDAVRVI